ncbi:hypothetical protein BGY98DRAFT_626999 [Russula aff. rugulosa BPL654]|nr:hypothetical protein BGY98DRAFT_626999 [Russula aff. rugulosa BPL654]
MHDRDLIIEYREVEGKSKTDRCVGGAVRKACASGGGFSTVGWHREVLFTQSCWSASETSLTKMNGVGIYYPTGTSKIRLRKSHSFGMFLIKKNPLSVLGQFTAHTALARKWCRALYPLPLRDVTLTLSSGPGLEVFAIATATTSSRTTIVPFQRAPSPHR